MRMKRSAIFVVLWIVLNHDEYVQKCSFNLEALEAQHGAELLKDGDPKSAKLVVKAISVYLDAGMISEASRTCRRMCRNDGMPWIKLTNVQE